MMTEVDDEALILGEIQDKYVPFLKKLIVFLEKNKKVTPDNLNRLKSIYTVFTTSSISEQIDTFKANKKKLEKWYKNPKKDSVTDDASDNAAQGNKRNLEVEDTDSSQGVSEATPAKKTRSSNQGNESPGFSPLVAARIKKEKADPPAASPAPTDDSPIIFTCASCQYTSQDEQEFMKHTRTDHRSDLSMWCKECGKCFSNAGVLVMHIKARQCSKEDMIYKCGVKECTFETTSGQTFVHHLRHCHKGSPFIFCVHCQKIFTLPHCLILHMQDECPFKDRNRRSGVSASSSPATPATPVAAAPATQRPSFTQVAPTIASVTSGVVQQSPAPLRGGLTPKVRGRGTGLLTPSRGRLSRGRGRGRSRAPSPSDSDSDADDPSWKPEELPGQSGLRRSGRFAKKVNDAVTAAPKSATKGITSDELRNAGNMIACPCCGYLAAFESVLSDHYIAEHKIANKNGCSECLVKFESTEEFIKHFKDHEAGKLPKGGMAAEADKSEPVTVQSQPKAAIPKSVPTVATEPHNEPLAKVVLDDEILQGVVQNLLEVDVVNPTLEESQCVKIPYQAAIHDKSSKDGKVKKFEDLKSQSDLNEMLAADKLKCFYKCAVYRCTYTSHDSGEYLHHLKKTHDGKMIRCAYCLQDFFSGATLVDHMMAEHSSRIFQCSSCFYRACSIKHLKAHIQHVHNKQAGIEILECEPVQVADNVEVKKEPTENTAWPYICAIGDCVFQSFDPKQFRIHNETVHRSVSQFFCHYCKVDFISFQRLFDHHRLHGINLLQCNYCIHGAETKEDILLHLCTVHADYPMKAFKRGLEEEDPSPTPNSSSLLGNNVVNGNNNPPRPASPPIDAIDRNLTNFEELLYEVVGETYYPKYLKSMATDFTCGVPFCKEKFEGMLTYIGHLRNHHSAVNFPCPHCPRISGDWDKFKGHLVCHGPNLFACGLVTCSFYDNSKSVVTEHLKSHSHSTAKVVIVREEQSGNDDIDTIKSLPETYSANISDTFYQCRFCLFKSSEKNVMKNHLYAEVMYRRFCCNVCNEKFVSRQDIKNHFAEKHPDQEIKCSVTPDPLIESLVQRFLNLNITTAEVEASQCGNCKKNFKTVIHFQQHLYLCMRKQYQPFDCNHCKASFHDLKMLKFHVDEKHFRELLEFTEVSSPLIEESLGPKLQKVRIENLKEAVSKENNSTDAPPTVGLVKYYTCNLCSYESNHKHNTQLHTDTTHKEEKATISKVLRNAEIPDLKSQAAESPKDESKPASKPYRCGLCIRKLPLLEDLQKHVEATHSVQDESKYMFYYWPDSKMDLSADTAKYECSYCKSGEDTLFALKRHKDFMHADSPFKVRGYVHHNKGWAPIACAYCYQRLESSTELKQHNTLSHPTLPPKSVGGFPSVEQNPLKRSSPDDSDEDPSANKRIRFPNSVFICTHCGSALPLRGQMTGHCKKAHPRLQPKFREEDEGGRTFLRCCFCTFTGEQNFLEEHLKVKHKSRVTCGYCSRQFEFASRLKEHHDQAHRDLPVKYSQEATAAAGKSTNHTASEKGTPSKRPSVLFVNTFGTSGSPSKRLTFSSFEKANDIYPKLFLRKHECEV